MCKAFRVLLLYDVIWQSFQMKIIFKNSIIFKLLFNIYPICRSHIQHIKLCILSVYVVRHCSCGATGILCYSLAFFSILWHPLASFSILCHPLAAFSILLASFSILWHPLSSFGILWHPLAFVGILWHPLASFGILWHSLASFSTHHTSHVPYLTTTFCFSLLHNICSFLRIPR